MSETTEPTERKRYPNGRGFALMIASGRGAELKDIASRGGQAAQRAGTAHRFTTDEAKEAGRKGGLARAAARRAAQTANE